MSENETNPQKKITKNEEKLTQKNRQKMVKIGAKKTKYLTKS